MMRAYDQQRFLNMYDFAAVSKVAYIGVWVLYYNNMERAQGLSYFGMQKEVKEQEVSDAQLHRQPTSIAVIEQTHRFGPPSSSRTADSLECGASLVKAEGEGRECGEGSGGVEGTGCVWQGGAGGKKPSLYHNFQKHLITTLKLHINLSSHRRSEQVGQRLMVQLWEYFIKSSRPTKRFLYSLLMNIPQNIIQFKNKYRDKTCQDHFHNILTQAPPHHIQNAQQQLRYQLMRQSQKIVQDGHLDARRMHKIDEFKDYFNRFIQDLERGELNLRLPKRNRILRRSRAREARTEEIGQ